jgi:hypothetical protein
MLQESGEEVSLCCCKAAECRAQADRATDPKLRQRYSNMERRWLLLAKSYELRERLSSFEQEARRRLKSSEVVDLMCPGCFRYMRVARMQPDHTFERSTDVITYECVCGLVLQQTTDRTN